MLNITPCKETLNSHLTEYFNHHFDIFLSAFRAQYSCQSTLLRVIENWKQALDQNKYVAAILMDLSKAVDCLPHDLLLLKLKTYGLSENARKLMASYLTNRNNASNLEISEVISINPQRFLRDPFWDQSFSTFSSMTSFISLKIVSCKIMQMIIRYTH